MAQGKQSNTIYAHVLMIILIICWGFDYVPAKWGLEVLTPSAVAFFKYSIGCLFMIVIKLCRRDFRVIRIKDLPIFIICAFFGQALYFECEYNAMNYIPVPLITIILGFVPVVSILAERVIYKTKANWKIYAGSITCIVGIALVVGSDVAELFNGQWTGYLLAIGAVFSWNIYNFMTTSLGRYDSLTLAATQMLCTALILLPLAVHSLPGAEAFDGKVIFSILWIGLIDSGLGYLIMVYGLKILGPTISAQYSNFLPVTAAFFSTVFLGESITLLQCIGGAIVIAAGVVVIREKGILDEERLQ